MTSNVLPVQPAAVARAAPVANDEQNTQDSGRDENDDGQGVRGTSIELDAGKFVNQQLDVRGRIVETKARADLPVPVGHGQYPHPYHTPRPNQDKAVSDTVASCQRRVRFHIQPKQLNAIQDV